VAYSEEGVKGLDAGEALAYYASTLGLDEVTPREVQSAMDVLKASNLVMRNADRGPVTVTDPFVRDSWLRPHTKGETCGCAAKAAVIRSATAIPAVATAAAAKSDTAKTDGRLSDPEKDTAPAVARS
jgi:hypothetical protein